MTTIDNAALARQLGYSKEQMKAKFGDPGSKTPTEIGNTLGLSSSKIAEIFGTQQSSGSSSDFSNYSVGDFVSGNVDNDALAKQLGYSKEEMEAKFGKPGEKTPEEIADALGLSNDEMLNIFGDYTSTDSADSSDDSSDSSSSDDVDSFIRTQDDKYKAVANALGYDELSVSAVMKAIENGVSGRPEEIVPQLASALGLPQTFVSNVLSYLNNGTI